MAMLAECPFCHQKQSTKNKFCKCGADLDKAKRAKKVYYWIQYRLPEGKQLKENIGKLLEEARAAHGKLISQKYESPRILEGSLEDKTTFQELTTWYLGLRQVQTLRSYKRI